jgi:uncharacterized protein
MGRSDVLRAVVAETLTDDKFGLPTVKDILLELEKPGRDPRGTFQYANFDDAVQDIRDMQVGMILEGVVSNVAAFGAFVDIGVHQDGLVHVSELGAGFVKDPRTVVKAGQTVKVRVVEIDVARKRIALSMRLQATSDQTEQQRRAPRDNKPFKPAPAAKPANTAFSNAFADALNKKR